jgi:hypothetical protein
MQDTHSLGFAGTKTTGIIGSRLMKEDTAPERPYCLIDAVLRSEKQEM